MISIKKIVNMLIPCMKNSYFIMPSENCWKDRYDLLNCHSDTALYFLNRFLKCTPNEPVSIQLVVFNEARIKVYKEFLKQMKNVTFRFVLYPTGRFDIKHKVSYLYWKFRSLYWVVESIPYIHDYATSQQIQYCLGYFTSCKADYVYKGDTTKIRKFCEMDPNKVVIFSSSYLDSVMKSAAYGAPMKCFYPFGLTRNDVLSPEVPNSEAAEVFINSLKINKDTKIVLFAPTYRDYEKKEDVLRRSIWGTGYDDERISRFLRENNIVVIAKLHPWQNEKVIDTDKSNIVLYRPTYEYNFYQLMKCADLMITDYSSIGFDWLLLDKPVVYNLYDLDIYREQRGLAYEPYEDMCAGECCFNAKDLMDAIFTGLYMEDRYESKRQKVLEVMYGGKRYDATSRVMEMIKKQTGSN